MGAQLAVGRSIRSEKVGQGLSRCYGHSASMIMIYLYVTDEHTDRLFLPTNEISMSRFVLFSETLSG